MTSLFPAHSLTCVWNFVTCIQTWELIVNQAFVWSLISLQGSRFVPGQILFLTWRPAAGLLPPEAFLITLNLSSSYLWIKCTSSADNTAAADLPSPCAAEVRRPRSPGHPDPRTRTRCSLGMFYSSSSSSASLVNMHLMNLNLKLVCQSVTPVEIIGHQLFLKSYEDDWTVEAKHFRTFSDLFLSTRTHTHTRNDKVSYSESVCGESPKPQNTALFKANTPSLTPFYINLNDVFKYLK